jgi:hypothetical protein
MLKVLLPWQRGGPASSRRSASADYAARLSRLISAYAEWLWMDSKFSDSTVNAAMRGSREHLNRLGLG